MATLYENRTRGIRGKTLDDVRALFPLVSIPDGITSYEGWTPYEAPDEPAPGVQTELDPELKAKIEKITTQADLATKSGVEINIANISDLAGIVIDNSVSVINFGSYSANSGLGGGKFVRVEDSTPVEEGVIYASKNGKKFKRDFTDRNYLGPEDFGWVKNNLTDFNSTRAESIRVQLLFDVASKYRVAVKFPDRAEFNLSELIYLREYIPEFNGNNSTFRFFNNERGSKFVGFLGVTRGAQPGLSSSKYAPAKDFFGNTKVHHFIIRYGDTTVTNVGFYLTNCSYVHVHDNDIETQHNHAINFILGGATPVDMYHNKAYNNRIKVKRTYDEARLGIAFTADMQHLVGYAKNVSPPRVKGMDEYWNEEFSGTELTQKRASGEVKQDRTRRGHAHPGKAHHIQPEVYNNYVEGARYAIAMYYCRRYIMRNNITKTSTRGLVNQNHCQDGKMYDNTVFDAISSPILVGYESNNNHISRNRVMTTTSNNQGYVQVNTRSQNNRIDYNVFEALPKSESEFTGPKWGVFMGIETSGTTIENNTIRGKIGKTVFLIDMAWVSPETEVLAAYGSETASNPGSWSYDDMKNIVIRGNILDIANNVPILTVLAQSDKNGPHSLDGLIYQNNIIRNNHGQRNIWFIERDTSKIKNVIMGGNWYPVGTSASQFVGMKKDQFLQITPDINRPSLAWEIEEEKKRISALVPTAPAAPAPAQPREEGIKVVNALETITETGIVACPRANFGMLSFRQPSEEDVQAGRNTLRQITGGLTGQIITVRFANNIAVEHDNSKIRLIGNRSLTTAARLNGNSVTFMMCLQGNGQEGNPSIWKEIPDMPALDARK